MSFQSRLLDARKHAGLTQAQLAERIGIAKSTYTGYEKGTSEPDMKRTILLMRVLNVDANYLWQDEMLDSGVADTALSDHEIDLVKKYRSLDSHGQKIVLTVLDLEAERCADALSGLIARQKEAIEQMRAEGSTSANEA